MLTKKLPTPITILIYVTIIAATATWLLPAGKYSTLAYDDNGFVVHSGDSSIRLPFTQRTLDSLKIVININEFKKGNIRKPVSIPGTYHPMPPKHQGVVDIIEAPIKGVYDTIDIILFILFLGGFINIFYQTGAMEKGLIFLSYKMKGKEKWLIIILTFLFSLGGASYGMAEEAMAFYPVIVPLLLAAGYDLLVPVAAIFGGTQLGTLASFSNPFSAIIASNTAGVKWTEGFYERVLMFIVSTAITIWYLSRYGKRIKRDPKTSLVNKIDGNVPSPYPSLSARDGLIVTLERKTRLLLWIFLLTFLIMITGVIFFDWWLLEMTALFLIVSVIIAFVGRLKERLFVEKFVKGAEGLLSLAFIVGVARGVTIILNDGYVSDTILFYSSQLVSGMPPTLFLLVLLVLYIIFTLFISSTSGMAVVTMPIISSLGIVAGVPGREIVNAYLFGMGIMGFISPTNLILPSLALVNNVSYKAWLRFIYPLLIVLFVISALFLIIGVKMG